MSSTILTVIVLVVMWVVVLVPMLVRRTDEEVLPEEVPSTGGGVQLAVRPRVATQAEEQVSASRAAMLARRRRALGTLITLVVATAILAAVLAPRLWAANAVCDLLFVGYLGWLRAEAKRAAELQRRRAARQARRPLAAVPRAAPKAPPQVVDLDDDDPSFAQLEEYYPRAVNE
jgi:hypothetical protein